MAVGEIPFFDLGRQIRELMPELEKSLRDVLSSGQFIMGDAVKTLENKIAQQVGSPHAIAVASGTDALLLSLKSLGVKEGDAVITTPFTFFSTASTIARLGARPLFVDIEPGTYNISVSRVERLIKNECKGANSGSLRHFPTGSNVKGILPVHIFGLMAEMKPLIELASEYGLFVLEDAAQALGASGVLDGKSIKAGAAGEAGIYSFYPTKNLGAFGDAGMVVTKRDDVAERIRTLRVHGAPAKDRFEEIGYLSRMDAMQAAILLTKLPHLEKWNLRRRELAKKYIEKMSASEWSEKVTLPVNPDKATGHIYHQFVIGVKERDRLAAFMRANGVGCETYYSKPLHLQPAFSFLNHKAGDLPEVERASAETLALPIWPELTQAEHERVIEVLDRFFKERNA